MSTTTTTDEYHVRASSSSSSLPPASSVSSSSLTDWTHVRNALSLSTTRWRTLEQRVLSWNAPCTTTPPLLTTPSCASSIIVQTRVKQAGKDTDTVLHNENTKETTAANNHNHNNTGAINATNDYNTQQQQQQQDDTTTTTTHSFLDALSESNLTSTRHRLDAFLVTHVPHRPVAMVTAGGTAVDLEQHTVRTLENFSTGWRGAVAVELLLRAGYAVVHVQRTGCTSPFTRILVEECNATGNTNTKNGDWGSCRPHQGLSLQALDQLVGRGDEHDDDDNENIQQEWEAVHRPSSDPWLTGSEKHPNRRAVHENVYDLTTTSTASELHLRRNLVHSSKLQKAVRERKATKGRLLTISFRTVQEYLAMVELCTTALQATAGPQALLFMAAAVSDFYLPNPTRHKIQSGATDSLVLELPGVPKTLGTVRRVWAPDAFLVSFKLETDETILQQKARRAMDKYGVHMVVGNLLHTRYDQVHLLLSSTNEWLTVDKPPGNEDNKEALEELLLQAIIEAHFAHMSGQGPPTLSSALKAKQVRLQRQHWWQRGKQVFWEVTGVAISLLLSYGINRLVLQHPRVRY